MDGSVTKDGSEAKESETEQQSKPKTPVLRKVNLTLRHEIIFNLIETDQINTLRWEKRPHLEL